METKDIIGKVVELKPDFLREMFGAEQSRKMKEARPHLVLELLYKGSPQLFAVPLQTNIKESLPNVFWEKLPPRLETREGMKRGMIFSSMIPISAKHVLKIKETEKAISRLPETREALFFNVINNVIIRRKDDLPEKAKTSLDYLRKQIYDRGASCFDDEAVNKAYMVISREIHNETYKIINNGLSPDENGQRPIVKKAQHYLDNHYLVTLANRENQTSRVFVDMPDHYTPIDTLVNVLRQSEQSEFEKTFESVEPPIRVAKTQDVKGQACHLVKFPNDEKPGEKVIQALPVKNCITKQEPDALYIVKASPQTRALIQQRQAQTTAQSVKQGRK